MFYAIYSYYPRLNIINGYAAKNMVSGLFMAGRSQKSIEEGDNAFSPVHLVHYEVDTIEKSVSASFFGLNKRKAIYIEGLGGILVNKEYDPTAEFDIPKRVRMYKELPYPYGNLPQQDTLFKEINYDLLDKAVEHSFDQPGEEKKKTRSVLVLYKDHVIAEKYAEGFDKTTPIHGWSMTKSIAATLYGILERQGKIDIYDSTEIKEWVNGNRKLITYNDLLHMNSGLEWEEDYFKISDVTKMLYLESNMGSVQIGKGMVSEPDESWNYSSGTTNLLSGPLLRKQFINHQEYLDFWYKELIDKIGMYSAVIETDLSGNYVGSSYAWASTRDWAKFGLLYLHEGNWNGEQILDSTWVKYVSTPTNTSKGRYGAHFWLNAGGYFPDVPKDLFSCNGFQGQYIFIIPSKEMIIVRTGLAEDPEFDVNEFLSDIIASIQ
jgi:CubicO group peptidase (beta-lactamase class C family)